MEAPRGDQAAGAAMELEATENPLHREAPELPPAAYAVAGLPAGKSGVAFRVTPVLHDRVLNYPERLAEAPEPGGSPDEGEAQGPALGPGCVCRRVGKEGLGCRLMR